MKFRLLILLILISKLSYSQIDSFEKQKNERVNRVIELFKQKNIDSISAMVKYPLLRSHPIPSIKTKKEFKQRFNEVFDETLINMIVNSKTDLWSKMGSQGIMFDGGEIWLGDYEGKIIAVNYESDAEKKLKSDLITNDNEGLHSSLKSFKELTHKFKTKSYLIRIDQLSNDQYRYASWKLNEKESSKPDLVLSKGEIEADGFGGNYVITFVNGKYTYKIYRNVIGASNEDIFFTVEKSGSVILEQAGTLIDK